DKARAKEQSLSQKFENVTRKEKEVQNLKSDLEEQLEVINVKKSELEKIQSKRVAELSKVSNMTPEEAKNLLMEAIKDKARINAMIKEQRRIMLARRYAVVLPRKQWKIQFPTFSVSVTKWRDELLIGKEETFLRLEQLQVS